MSSRSKTDGGHTLLHEHNARESVVLVPEIYARDAAFVVSVSREVSLWSLLALAAELSLSL